MLCAIAAAFAIQDRPIVAVPPSPRIVQADWMSQVRSALPILGHRNWIVVADSAYPSQISPGVKTIWTGEDHVAVLDAVMRELGRQKHVDGVYFLDKELTFLDDALAPGVNSLKDRINSRMLGKNPTFIPHEQMIAKLDEAGKTFTVLLLKTKATLPYTSVFIQLDCGYWGPAKERALRDRMSNGN